MPADEVGSFWVVSLHLIDDGHVVSDPTRETTSPILLLFWEQADKNHRQRSDEVFLEMGTRETFVDHLHTELSSRLSK